MPDSLPSHPDAPAPAMPAERPILIPGETCWRIARADRVSLIVDAKDYFAAAKAVMLTARRRIMMIGWDFDLQIRLEPDRPDARQPDRLGPFVQHLVTSRPGLCAYILKWDMAALKTITRQIIPLLAMRWMTMRRIRFRLDSRHPLDACHHQKLLVVDDSAAFCGGIDMTRDRWDTRDHREADPCRVEPDGTAYGPFHDVAAMFDGEAAAALGELARRRWHLAGGRRLLPVPLRRVEWPERGASVSMRDVDIAIARTEPAYAGEPGAREIQNLYLAAIAAARRTIYLESQYFSSNAIADALKARLAEPDGPEVVVVNPESAEGWLESLSMDTARCRIVNALRRADRHDRFRIYHPVNAAGTPIYVHAKVMVIDDRLLRVGSSNLNNRSMGFDTECDVAIDAAGQTDEAAVRTAIVGFRTRLLAEHLDVPGEELEAAVADGSLVAAIDRLRRDQGRSLRPLEVRAVGETEAALIELDPFNPETPRQRERRVAHLVKGAVSRAGPLAAGVALGLGVMAAARWWMRRR